MKKIYTNKIKFFAKKELFIGMLFSLSFLPAKQILAQTKWYYNGTGALNNVASWGTNTNGTAGTLTDFTSGGRIFIIQNTTAVSLNGIWNVGNTFFGNAGGDSIVIGNPTTTAPAISLTLLAVAALTVNKSRTIFIAAPSSGNQKIIYQNSTPLSLGAIADTTLEVVFDGATITTTSSSRFGNISLINNANVTMGGATLSFKNLLIGVGSTLSGPIGASSNYLAVLRGGSVTINGTFKAGRSGGLYSTGVTVPVVPVSTNGTLLFQDTTRPPNLTLGSASTVDYYRGTTNQSGNQTIEPLDFANLTLSNSLVASNKTFGTGTTTVSGILTVNLLGGINAPIAQNISLKPGAKLVIVSPTAFTTPTGTGKFTLESNASVTASIAALPTGASIVGNVTIQQFIPAGSRKFRFLSHPFNTAQPLNQLSDDINITGNTAGTNLNVGQTVGYGFTPTSTNNPSAYYFNTATADGSAVMDAGWKAFIDDSTSNWKVGQGIRILTRGRRNQSNTLNGYDSVPRSATLDLTGNINNGTTTINLLTGGTGSTAGFNLVGNPYPSPVDIGAVLNAATNIGTSIYLRNPQTGSYITINPIPASFVVPAYSAFFVKALAATSLVFNETNKANCTTCLALFRAAPTKNHIEINAIKNGETYDNFNLNYGSSYSNRYEEAADGIKLLNNGLNIYSLSADKQKLATDYRNINNTTIQLGIAIPESNGIETYTLKVVDFSLNSEIKLMLHDKLFNKYILLNKDASYKLIVDPLNKNSIGENRLEIIFKK